MCIFANVHRNIKIEREVEYQCYNIVIHCEFQSPGSTYSPAIKQEYFFCTSSGWYATDCVINSKTGIVHHFYVSSRSLLAITIFLILCLVIDDKEGISTVGRLCISVCVEQDFDINISLLTLVLSKINLVLLAA